MQKSKASETHLINKLNLQCRIWKLSRSRVDNSVIRLGDSGLCWFVCESTTALLGFPLPSSPIIHLNLLHHSGFFTLWSFCPETHIYACFFRTCAAGVEKQRCTGYQDCCTQWVRATLKEKTSQIPNPMGFLIQEATFSREGRRLCVSPAVALTVIYFPRSWL